MIKRLVWLARRWVCFIVFVGVMLFCGRWTSPIPKPVIDIARPAAVVFPGSSKARSCTSGSADWSRLNPKQRAAGRTKSPKWCWSATATATK